MTDDAETERVKRVYAGYGASGRARHWSAENPGNRLIIEERDRAVRACLERHGLWPLADLEILEIGCGTGANLGRLLAWGASPARLHGIDLLPERINAARARWPMLDWRVADAREFNLGPNSVDLAFLFTIMSSVLDEAASHAIVARVREMVRPTGAVVWYDFYLKNPLNPHTRRMRCKDIAMLFPGFQLDLEAVTLLPPLARRLGPLATTLYPVLARMPGLRGFYAGLLRPEATVTVAASAA